MVVPETFLVGFTQIHWSGMRAYLLRSGNTEFLRDLEDALKEGVSSGEALCSFYAKLCYKSLTLGQNANVSRVRSIRDNIQGCFDQGHGSVFRHCNINFVTTKCSRILTHELVRHGAGTAFSQTSGRYVALDEIEVVDRPEVVANHEVHTRLTRLVAHISSELRWARGLLMDGVSDFGVKKKITSALRAYAPNGQTNEIGWSVNIQSLRHILVLRSSRHAEWEIRVVANQVAEIVQAQFPLMLYGMERKEVDGLGEWTGVTVV